MLVLGLETSCDETGVALYDTERGLLSHALFSQVDLHVEYGGVVPELASRDHVRKILPLIQQVFDDAGCQLSIRPWISIFPEMTTRRGRPYASGSPPTRRQPDERWPMPGMWCPICPGRGVSKPARSTRS